MTSFAPPTSALQNHQQLQQQQQAQQQQQNENPNRPQTYSPSHQHRHHHQNSSSQERITPAFEPPRYVEISSHNVPRQAPPEEETGSHYFDSDRNVFYRPNRDVSMGDIAAAPMGTYDWNLVRENPSEEEKAEYEMSELEKAAILERHPCGDQMTAILNTSRSLPVGVVQSKETTMAAKGNFKRALEVAQQAGGAGGASHSLLYSKGGPERKINTAEMKWGPVKFSDMGTVALGEKITRDVIELRRAFSKRDAIVTLPDYVTPEALEYRPSRFGTNWEMFDIAKHADLNSTIMKVYLERHATTGSRKALAHGSESSEITYNKQGDPVWHRKPGEKALLSGAFKVAEHPDEPLIGPDGVENSDAFAEANVPLPPLPDPPKGWPKGGPGNPPPSSQEGLRQKRFKLEDRVPALKEILEADKARQSVAAPKVEVGSAFLKKSQKEDLRKKMNERLPVWRPLRSPTKGDGGEGGKSPSFLDVERSPQHQVEAPVGTQRSAPRTREEVEGPASPARLHSTVMTPAAKPELGVYNPPMVLRSPGIVDERHKMLQSVEKKRDWRGQIVKEDRPEDHIGEVAQQNTKVLGQLLSPPPVPFSEVRRTHTDPMIPYMAVSGVPKFDAVKVTEDLSQTTMWKELMEEI